MLDSNLSRGYYATAFKTVHHRLMRLSANGALKKLLICVVLWKRLPPQLESAKHIHTTRFMNDAVIHVGMILPIVDTFRECGGVCSSWSYGGDLLQL